jgi:hypothetical protein
VDGRAESQRNDGRLVRRYAVQCCAYNQNSANPVSGEGAFVGRHLRFSETKTMKPSRLILNGINGRYPREICDNALPDCELVEAAVAYRLPRADRPLDVSIQLL